MNVNKKIALVTGASSGLGWALCCGLAEKDYHVLAVARSLQGLEKLDDTVQARGGQVTLVPMDLLDYPAIYRLAKSVNERFGGTLELLMGCAASLPGLMPLHHYTPLDWETSFGVNCTANWHLVRAFYPLLKESKNAAKAVFITDKTTPRAYWGPYSASKRALEDMVCTFQSENQHPGVTFHLFAPAKPMATPLRQKAMPGMQPGEALLPERVAQELLESVLLRQEPA